MRIEAYQDALIAAWREAKAMRRSELRGRRGSSFDARGLHAYSVEWGRILAIEEACPGLSHLREDDNLLLTPWAMRNLAARDAEREFVADAAAGTEGLFA